MKTHRENDVANGSRNLHRINDAPKGCMTTVVCFLSIGEPTFTRKLLEPLIENFLYFLDNLVGA